MVMKEKIEFKQLRSFGLIVGGIFGVIGLWPIVFSGENTRLWAIIFSSILILLALIFPKSLKPVFKVWMKIGFVLGWVNTRILLAIVFYGLFLPIGLVRRMMKGDPLNCRLLSEVPSYRVTKEVRPTAHKVNQF